jgi:hypothetical protein
MKRCVPIPSIFAELALAACGDEVPKRSGLLTSARSKTVVHSSETVSISCALSLHHSLSRFRNEILKNSAFRPRDPELLHLGDETRSR